MDVAAGLLVNARRRAGLTQGELARRAGIPQPVLSAYERGRRQPSVAAVSRILEAAGFRLAITRRPDAERAGRALRDLLSLVERLPSSRRRPLSYPRLPERRVR